MKIYSYNKKTNTGLNNRTRENLSVIFILFSVNLLNCECFWPLTLLVKTFIFMFSEASFILMLFKTNLVFILFVLMLFGNPPNAGRWKCPKRHSKFPNQFRWKIKFSKFPNPHSILAITQWTTARIQLVNKIELLRTAVSFFLPLR